MQPATHQAFCCKRKERGFVCLKESYLCCCSADRWVSTWRLSYLLLIILGELQFGIDMEEEIETGTQLGTYHPRYQPVDSDIKQQIDAIDQARKMGISKDPALVIRSLQAQNYWVIKWDGMCFLLYVYSETEKLARCTAHCPG